MSGSVAARIARMGVLVALAMIFSYIEVLIPISIGIPGVKLGLANLVIVIGLYLCSGGEVFLISLVRILLMGFLFGNSMSLAYSLAGGILSFGMMWMAKKWLKLSVIGVSIVGGVFHNVGQLAAAAFTLQNPAVAAYLPVLLVAGVVTGMGIGVVSKQILSVLKT